MALALRELIALTRAAELDSAQRGLEATISKRCETHQKENDMTHTALTHGVRVQTANGHIQDGAWILVPVEDLQTPRGGRICSGSRWWILRDGKFAQFFRSYGSAQCNPSEGVARAIMDARRGSCERAGYSETIIKVEMAFIPHDCSDYASA